MDRSPRQLWIFRHGLRADWLTDFSPELVHARDNDIAPAGVRQFEYCADYLATQPVDHLISSPYRRCVHSAEIIARRLGLPIRLENGIHESHGGPAPALLSPAELKRDYPHVDAETPSLFPLAENESETDSRLRCGRVLLALLERWPGNLVIVSHGNPIVGMQEALVPGFQRQGMRCAHFSRFEFHHGRWHAAEPYALHHLGPVDVSAMRHFDWNPDEEAARLVPRKPAPSPNTIS